MGCTGNNRHISTSESIECQKLKVLFNNLEKENIKTLIFYGEDCNEPVDEATFEEFRETVLYLAGCCFPMPHPLANEWVSYNRLECIRQYLEDESVRRIAFYDFDGTMFDEEKERPEDWGKPWAEITEPKRIKEVLRLLFRAMDKEKDRFANEDVVMSTAARMQIITDKHKFIIPISCYKGAIRGIGWTSYELRGQLKKWGFSDPA